MGCEDRRLWSRRLLEVVFIESSDVVAVVPPPRPPTEAAVPIDIILVSIVLLFQKI